MKQNVVLCFALLMLFPSVVVGIQENNMGEITGKVLNASLDSIAMADQKVMLYQYIDNQEVQGERPVVYSDRNGIFIFKDLEINERYAYYPLILYNEIEYRGKVVKPTEYESHQESDILVFESISSDSAIVIASHHLFIDQGVDNLIVNEILMYVNKGNYTYVGTTPAANGKSIVLPMEIPENAKEVLFGGDLMDCCVILDGNLIFDTMEFTPGIRNVKLQYLIPYSKSVVNFDKIIAHPTENFDVFVSDPITINGIVQDTGTETLGGSREIALEDAGPIQLQGGIYNRYKKNMLKKGTVITLTISNIPDPIRDYRWLAPVVLIFIITAGYVFQRRNERVRIAQKNPHQ